MLFDFTINKMVTYIVINTILLYNGKCCDFYVGGNTIVEQIEKLKDKLYNLILKEDSLYRGEILKVSQELDKQIVGYYLGKKKCS